MIDAVVVAEVANKAVRTELRRLKLNEPGRGGGGGEGGGRLSREKYDEEAGEFAVS